MLVSYVIYLIIFIGVALILKGLFSAEPKDLNQDRKSYKCPKCSSLVYTDDRFCNNCGARISGKCSNCDSTILYDAKYCKTCGGKVRKADEPKDTTSETGASLSSFLPKQVSSSNLPNKSDTSSKTNGEKRRSIYTLLAIIFLCLAIYVLVYLFLPAFHPSNQGGALKTTSQPNIVDQELSYCPNLGNGKITTEGTEGYNNAFRQLILTLPKPAQEKMKQPWTVVNNNVAHAFGMPEAGQPMNEPERIFPCRAASQTGENANYAYCRAYIERGPITDSSGLILYKDKIIIRIGSVYNRNTGELISQECTQVNEYSMQFMGYQ